MTARYYSSEDDDTPAPTCSLQRAAQNQAVSPEQRAFVRDLESRLALAERDRDMSGACVDRLRRELGEREGECAALSARVKDLELVLCAHMRQGVQA